MAQCRWAGEGAEVNYSITGWLRQELFKQDRVSRGLVLITPAKAMPRTLFPRPRNASGLDVPENIHTYPRGERERVREA